jgi:2'-5' RNA ligase
MSDQRLFFALWPNATVRDGLVKGVHECPEIKGQLHHPSDLHMTLVFLGQVKEQQFSCVENVAQTIEAEKFELLIDHTGYWPRPKITWAAPESTPRALVALVDGLKQRLQACGFEPEQRPYRPHVTLYRKSRRSASWRLTTPVKWSVDEFVLASSNSGGSGQSRYRVVKRWALR